MTEAEKLIRFIKPDKRLSVTLAITLAWEALPVFEEIHPNDLRPRKAIELSWGWLAGEEVSREELRAAATAATTAATAAYAVDVTDVTDVAAYAAAAATAATARATYAVAAVYAGVAYWPGKALGNNIIPDLFQSLIPLIIDYAIQNKVKLFTGPGNFDEVFETLSEDYRDKVWYNMELFFHSK